MPPDRTHEASALDRVKRLEEENRQLKAALREVEDELGRATEELKRRASPQLQPADSRRKRKVPLVSAEPPVELTREVDHESTPLLFL